jgi:elongation factor Ts
MINVNDVKSLRDRTGISITQCQKALVEAGGDMEKALEALKKAGVAIAQGKSGRTLAAGAIGSYIHGTGDVGAMVELLCETDFVGKNEEFKKYAYNLAMHLAASPAETKEEFLASAYIRDPQMTIGDILKEIIQKFGENTDIGHFGRFSVSGR